MELCDTLHPQRVQLVLTGKHIQLGFLKAFSVFNAIKISVDMNIISYF